MRRGPFVHPLFARANFTAAKELYQAGVFNEAALHRSCRRCFRHMSKKTKKQARRETKNWIKLKKHVEAFLLNELARLETITVNDQSPHRLKEAAPDTYHVIKTHLTRRLHQIRT